MPVEYAAFCELHRPRYLSYARVWLPDAEEAAASVQEALCEVAAHWRELLVSSNPTAQAWHILRTTVSARLHSGPARGGAPSSGPESSGPESSGRVSGPVPSDSRPVGPQDEDLAILHYVVGLAAPEIADVVGSDTANIAGRLRRAVLHDPAEW